MQKFELLAILALLSPAACTSVSVDISIHDAITKVSMDLTGECTGTGSKTDDNGTATWTKNTMTGNCKVVVEWVGKIIPTNQVNAEIEDEAGNHVKKIEIKELTVTAKDVQLTDAMGAVVTPPMISEFGASAQLVDTNFYVIPDAQNLTKLLQNQVSVTLTAPNVILDAINNALNNDTALDGKAEAHMTLSNEAVAPLQVPAKNPLTLQFVHDFEISADAKVGI